MADEQNNQEGIMKCRNLCTENLKAEYIPGAIFILDKFHLSKYILTATAHAPELKKLIYRGIKSLNKKKVLEYLYEALKRAQE